MLAGCTSATLPAAPDDITPGWLTRALRTGGHLGPGGEVSAVEARVVSEGTGFIGIVARIAIEYAGEARGAPASLVAKLPSSDPGSRQVGLLYGLYEREVRFYGELAEAVGVATPRCYFAAHDGEAGRSVVLLEELRDGTFGDQVAGCTLAEARLAVTELARLHARWWGSARLTSFPWLVSGVDLIRAAMTMAYDACWAPCVERFGYALTPAFLRAGPALGQRILASLDLPEEPVTALVHGDFRLDNLFFGAPGSDRSLVVCDWQSPNPGWPSYDLIYFLAGSFEPAVRRACQDELVALYHQALVAGGVGDYSREALHLDCRRSLVAMAAIFVINGATLPTVNARSVSMIDRTLARATAAIDDLDAFGTLP